MDIGVRDKLAGSPGENGGGSSSSYPVIPLGT